MATIFMNLDLPTVSVTLGPAWASMINEALELIDSHDHTSGNGSLIPAAALNINSDLSFGGFNQISIMSTRFSSQGAALAGSNDKECIYSVGGALYYNNASGVAVQITSGTGLNLASIGTIGGDYGGVGVTASVTYNNTSKAYSFLQAPSATAKMAMADILLYEANTAANAITIKSPASLASSYDLTMFAALPASSKIVRMTSGGVLQNDLDADNSTLEISGSALRIKDLGVVTAKINDLAVTTAKIADSNVTTAKILDNNVTTAKINNGAVTLAKLASVSRQVSGSSGSFGTSSTSYVAVTNLSVTITGVGNRTMCLRLASASGSTAYLQTQGITLRFYNVTLATTVAEFKQGSPGGTVIDLPASAFMVDTPSATGSTTYRVEIKCDSGASASVFNTVLVAYEV